MKKHFRKTCLSLPLILSSFGYADNAQMGNNGMPPTSVIGNLGAKDKMRTCVDGWGGYAVGSFIYWKSQIHNLDIVGKQKSLTSIQQATLSPKATLTFEEMKFEYDPGFKLGAGFNFKRDVWDIFLNWTSLESSTSKSYNSSYHNLTALLSAQIDHNNGGEHANHARANWNLQFNALDFELGRDFYLGKYVKLRPFGSLKTGWIEYHLRVKYTDIISSQGNPVANSDVHVKDHVWGIGPRFGLNTRWILGKCNIGILANFSASLLWESMHPEWDEKVFSGNPQSVTFPNQEITFATRARRKEINPVFELMLGLDWGVCIRKTSFLTISAGYEAQYWMDQFVAVIPSDPYNDRSLDFRGLTTSLSLDF